MAETREVQLPKDEILRRTRLMFDDPNLVGFACVCIVKNPEGGFHAADGAMITDLPHDGDAYLAQRLERLAEQVAAGEARGEEVSVQ